MSLEDHFENYRANADTLQRARMQAQRNPALAPEPGERDLLSEFYHVVLLRALAYLTPEQLAECIQSATLGIAESRKVHGEHPE